MENKIENLIKEITPKEVHKETPKRIIFFFKVFKLSVKEAIDDEELLRRVVYEFMIYGQEYIYSMLSRLSHQVLGAPVLFDINLEDNIQKVSEHFKEFRDTIENELKLSINDKSSIHLYLKYLYSLVLKK